MSNKSKILIVDDETAFTEILKLNLEATGKYEVCIENDPRFALYTARRFKPSLVLLDIIMPQLEGPDVAMEIRHDSNLHGTPIVYLTATVTHEEVDSQRGRIGGNQFVANPSSLKDLLTAIESSLLESV